MVRDPKNTRMPKEEKQYDERVVAVDRVARVVKGGRRFRFRALVVVGDGKGKIGVGTAKGADVTAAVAKATEVAKKSIVVIALNKETIPHEQQARVGGAKILLKPAAPGTGLIAGGVVRVVLEVAGIRNILSKSLGSSNKINTAYATVDALKAIQPHAKWHTNTLVESRKSKVEKVEASPKEKSASVESKEEKK